MAVTIVSHVLDAQRGVEIVKVIDSHGRQHEIHAGILPGHPDAEAFIQGEIDKFAEQEKVISAHIEARFDRETLERR